MSGVRRLIPFLLSLPLIVAAATSAFPQTGADTAKPLSIGLTDQIFSAKLGEERKVNLYFPEGYKREDNKSYPVIYLLDGGIDEDFIHVSGIVQFDSFDWIARVPPSIVVGIVNVDRRRDMTFQTTVEGERKRNPTSGHSDKFIAFLRDELQPFIASKYHGSGPRTIIGESLGGLLATEVLLKEPSLFDKYIIVSPSIWWDNGSILNLSTDRLKSKKSPTSVYIGVGFEGLTPTETPRVQAVDANLLDEKLRKIGSSNLGVVFDYLPAEDHPTVSHQAIFNAFRLLYPAPKK